MTAPGPVELVVEAPAWLDALPDLQAAADAAAAAALAEAGLDPQRWQLTLLACDDRRIAALNQQFRGLARPTNVLSWPAFALSAARPGAPPPAPPEAPAAGPGHLGDVALALQTAAAEAQSRGVSLKSHVIHLILHGVLHLLGYDHQTDEDAALMEGIETRLLDVMGYPDPHESAEADAVTSAS